MDYSDTLDFLFLRLPMFQRIGPAAYKDNLDNTVKLDSYFGNPHRQYKTVHIAGTNGKGSVSHMLAAVLQEAGYKTGLYTSPHLKDFRERIRINGEMISTGEVTEWVKQFRAKNAVWNIDPSFFELTVAMAFDFFAKKQVDAAIVETGLGGRLDSTNVISPEVSIITNIGLDHTAMLGDTLEKIAYEKAGIIKAGIPVVIGTTHPETKKVFEEVSALKLAPLFFADKKYTVKYSMTDLDGNQLLSVQKDGKNLFGGQLKLDLLGLYQQLNLPAVLKTIELLIETGWNITETDIIKGLANTRKMTGLSGRWQVLGYNPLLVCDTVHNADGMKEAVKQIKQTPYDKLHMILGVVKDKDPEKLIAMLPVNAEYYFTKADIPRAMEERELARIASGYGLEGSLYSSVSKALDAALEHAGKNDMIFVGGSIFVVAEIM